MAIKIVVDTSVFISALIGSKGSSREIIRRCLKGEYQPLMGNDGLMSIALFHHRLIGTCK